MYLYLYMCMHMYMYMYMCAYTCTYVYAYTYAYTYVHVYAHVYVSYVCVGHAPGSAVIFAGTGESDTTQDGVSPPEAGIATPAPAAVDGGS